MSQPFLDRVIASVLTILAVAAAVTSTAVGQPIESGLVETSRVEVVESWPFVVEGDWAVCSTLGARAFRVTENGQEVEVVAVEPAPQVTTQALMLDTSRSMSDRSTIVSRKRGRQTKVAAKAYVNWMLEDAGGPTVALMVFTFDDDLLLRSARTPVTDRAGASRLQREIDRISGGFQTALNDAVVQVVRFLGSSPERAVVLLLSDGADTTSTKTYEAVETALKETNNVTLFPIGIGLSNDRYQRFLESLAAISGGKYYWVRDTRPEELAGPLEKRFRNIRTRVKSQLYVSWYAQPYGASGERPADPEGRVRREVRIRSLDARCKVPHDGYRPERSVLGPAGPSAEDSGAAGPISSAPDEQGARVVRLQLADMLLDPDPLVRYEGDPQGADVEMRTVEILLPSLIPDARSGGGHGAAARSPEDVIHDWLLDGRIPETSRPGEPPRVRQSCFPTPHEMSGKAFLAHREIVARAIFDRSDELRAWARTRFSARLRADYAARLPSSGDPASRERVLDTVLEQRLRVLSPVDYVRYLAGWSRDVPARELALDVERKEANLLLGGGESGAEIVGRLQDRWVRLHDWLYFPERTRVLTPLEPIFVPEGDGLQFFRIILPRLGDLPEDPDRAWGKLVRPKTAEQWIEYERVKVPSHPFGLLTVRWLLGLPPSGGKAKPAVGDERQALALEFVEHWRVSAMVHVPVPISPSLGDTEGPSTGAVICREEVQIDFGPRDSVVVEPEFRLKLVVDFEGEGERATEGQSAYSCSAESTVARVVPRCYATTAGGAGRARIVSLLGKAGVAECEPTRKPGLVP